MGKPDELRQFSRVPISIEVRVALEGASEPLIISGLTRDLSMKGIYVVSQERLPVGTDCRVTLVATGGLGRVRVEAKAKVVRLGKEGMGVEFVEIIGLESFEHLRNFVLYNSQETERVEEEFRENLGILRRV